MTKIGEGHADAMLRLGLKELRNAFNPSRDSVAGDEMGIYGTATQGEIANARDGAGDGPEQESASLDDVRSAAREQERQNQQGQDGPEQDRGLEM